MIGAGPTGLGAAWRLETTADERGRRDWCLVDAGDAPGGMATSVTVDGFTWDLGGHVLFPHYEEFDRLLDELVDDWCEVVPVRGAWMFDRFIPYPVQRNLRHFPEPLLDAIVDGLRHRPQLPEGPGPVDFETLLLAQFGRPLYESFLGPLNRKMWAVEPSAMSVEWTGHQSGSNEANVPLVDVDEIVADIEAGRDRPGWSDDTRVRYPSVGGTGSIWRRLARRLPPQRLRFGSRVERVFTRDRVVEFADGQRLGYRHLVNSMPLDVLLRSIIDQPALTALADELRPARTTVVGIGIEGTPPESLRGVCSLYVPDPALAFWRLTVLSNYSPHCAPPGHWSLLCESNSADAVADPDELVAASVAGLESLGLCRSDRIVSTWRRRLGHGYPVPLRGRDLVLDDVAATLEPLGILTRGRFGGWRYEVSNQDHAFMQGVEAVDRITLAVDEVTYPRPRVVNER